ncbi:DNA cytosine methyltransferase [Euryhalocaulis caribicus]|uniref:DNA cytosine methyltransferase n=1 Tax=Euryhalocaulis caribicus TaxID=1161401 RepID=UPI0003A4D5A9|nr:DNA cytosine methyltransferase [Euryhalocaulis caribicus]
MQGLIVDSFAGGGGASCGIEMALGRSPDIAINHDADALAMHAVNHPDTLHLTENIWQVDPDDVCGSRPIDLFWASPDCKHFSKAKGGTPVNQNIRGLAWVVVRWAQRRPPERRPRVILLENVEEFRDWGPVLVAEDGKAVPCAKRRGEEFKAWVKALRQLGYRVDWRELRACDYGAPTIRKRLFIIARRDGQPIVWPEPTHAPVDDPRVIAGQLKPWRSAADIIDWSAPCPSIFDTSAQIMEKFGVRAKRPLAPATERRVARGVQRYVLDNPEPFIVSVAHGDSGGRREYPLDDPLGTLTQSPQHAVVAPVFTYGQQGGAVRSPEEPHSTVTASIKDTNALVVAAFMAQHNTGVTGHDARAPVSTITGRGTQQQLVACHMINMKGSDRRERPITDPAATGCAGGGHAGMVAAFLTKYYGTDQAQIPSDPLHTATAKARFGLVAVTIGGAEWVLTDIGMRMLTPRELFRAQGFPDSYIIDHRADGSKLTKTAQTRMAGNSVCPPLAEALARANAPFAMAKRAAA